MRNNNGSYHFYKKKYIIRTKTIEKHKFETIALSTLPNNRNKVLAHMEALELVWIFNPTLPLPNNRGGEAVTAVFDHDFRPRRSLCGFVSMLLANNG